MAIDKVARRVRIKYRIRKKVAGTAERPRLSVFRSNTTVYVQLIDDQTGRTLAAASTKEVSQAKSANKESAHKAGKLVAEKALAQGISKVVFDRGGYLYHGKIQSVAEGAREGGLIF